MRTTWPTEMFSLRVILRLSISSDRSSMAASPLVGHQVGQRASTKATNCSDLATKSVSDRSCTIEATPSARPMATAPSEASRSARLAWLALPCSRSNLMALSMSPWVSSSAFLASSIPTPVSWRSFWTSLAVNSGTAQTSSLGGVGSAARSAGAALLPLPAQQAGPTAAGAGSAGTSAAGGAGAVVAASAGAAASAGGAARRVRRASAGAAASGAGAAGALRARSCRRRGGRGRNLCGRCRRRSRRPAAAAAAVAGTSAAGASARRCGRRGGRRGRGGGRRGPAPAPGPWPPRGRSLLGDEPALHHGVGHHPAQQGAGADGVVVPRDDMGDHVGIAVGVDHGHHRQPELVGLGDRDVLLLRVDDEDGVGEPIEAPDPAQVALELLELPGVAERFLLGHGLEVPGPLHGLELLHPLHPGRDGLEVGEHATQPPLVHVRHPAGVGVDGHRALGLLLRAHEQDGAPAGDEVTDVAVGLLDPLHRLAKVDQVDPVALPEDEPAHLRVPTPGLVPEVDARAQQLLHRDDGHETAPWNGFRFTDRNTPGSGATVDAVGCVLDPACTPRRLTEHTHDSAPGHGCSTRGPVPGPVPGSVDGPPAGARGSAGGPGGDALGAGGRGPAPALAPGSLARLPAPSGRSASLARSCSTALVWIWQTRDSVTPRMSPISARVRPS